MKFIENDGGRAFAGYKGEAGDCVTRAIAIATESEYDEVYDALFARSVEYGETKYNQVAKRIQAKGSSPRNGSFKEVYRPYLESLGWKWIPTMGIGTGCKVHLKSEELPTGRLIVRVSKHITTVIDGVLHDTYDCSREGTRCVYGYYIKE